ncbi:uncharacterized protein LOC115691618 isoform X1 [Syzygium oleosum]|uniref:uncharacterized protein LOC115691618 isoform X1 n=1 Tax=Syzygium oleosum TaxID=219896 RepID=UPI0011D2443A|nr:uncharacterized protein LOC115691618 isoform X1 [Syzygium oleosum]XP_056175392.1 uncharacterized protein LOC115691618 isoform X1 [Syzygium oleosum]
MSGGTMSESDNSFDAGELLEIGTRCRELGKERDMLRESQSRSFELIKKLEHHVNSLSDARAKDEKYIRQLEKELMNCSQEIDYLQDQIGMRTAEVKLLEEQVLMLELKLEDMETLEQKVGILSEELRRSDSVREFLIQELETKEVELIRSTLCIEKLEESISSAGLESQCEIESMKLDLMALEENYFEAKKGQDEVTQEKERISRLMEEVEVQFKGAKGVVDCLEKENKELREKLDLSETNVREFCRKIEEYFEELLDDNKRSKLHFFKGENGCDLTFQRDMGETFVQLLSEINAPDAVTKEKMKKMSLQILEYELLVKRLKEELREEKLKAKDEAEDMAQEMAELRYQITGLLEEERKRRASIEQASLQRIAELEAQVQKEQGRSSTTLSISNIQ